MADDADGTDDGDETEDVEANLRGLAIDTSGDAEGSISVSEGRDVTEVSTDNAEPLEESTNREAANYMDVDTDLGEIVSSATFEVSVSADNVDDPEDVTIHHYVDGEWTDLETDHVETENDEHTVEATTDGFSTFAVGVDVTTDEEPEETDEQTETDDETPGFGLLIAVVALLGVAAVLAKRRP